MQVPEQLLGRTLLIVAHPDDETVGCGTLLQRIAEPVVVFCTDGAPHDRYFWEKSGSRLRYARERQEEGRRAMSLAGVNELVFLAEHAGAEEMFVDQELYRSIEPALELLDGAVRQYRPQALLTLAYEGGHPDHDTCSFLAFVTAQRRGLPVWEFPLYHRNGSEAGGHGQMAFQRFVVPSDQEEILLEIMPDELETKQGMLAAYGSQQPFLSEFDPAIERVRRQHAYDYARPPQAGAINYEAWGWKVTAKDVCTAFQRSATGQRKIA